MPFLLRLLSGFLCQSYFKNFGVNRDFFIQKILIRQRKFIIFVETILLEMKNIGSSDNSI